MSNLLHYRRQEKPLPHELLVMYRKRSGLTQVELAKQLDFKSSKMLQLWENGYQLPVANRLKKLIEIYYALGVFTSGKEYQEVRELWNSVQDTFDTRSENYQTYPIFDEHWFETLQPVTTSTKNQPPLHLTQPNNLPASATHLIGRKREIEQLCQLIRQDKTRLVTLTGPGGTGKTRLAVQVASLLLGDFREGVYFVELAATHDPALLLANIAGVLGVKESGNLLENLQDYLRERQLLLILDNFEQIVAAAPQVASLLEADVRLKVVVTSRIVLRLYGEQEFNLLPLQLPPANESNISRLADVEAVQLFVERARLVKADFILTAGNARSITRICTRLEGLPLALELASSRLKIFSPQALLERLEGSSGARLKLLTGGARNLSERQQTLRNTLEWSYGLLEPDLRILFQRLAVFSGGVSLEAASAICGYPDNLHILEGVTTLVDHSLLRVVKPYGAADAAEPGFDMLETIREYGLEKLAESEEEESIRQRHSDYYLALLEKAQPELQTVRQPDWLNRLEQNHPNLRSALEWALAGDEAETERSGKAVRMGVILAVFWNMRGHLSEGRKWIKLILDKNQKAEPALRARLLNNGALLAGRQGDALEAVRLLEEALAVWRELGDKRNISLALNNLGTLAFKQGDLSKALQIYQEGLELKRSLGEPRGLAATLNNLGELLQAQGDFVQAQQYYEESLALLKTLGDTHNVAIALLNLGKLLRQRNQLEPASQYLTQSLQLLLEVGDKFNLAENLESLAEMSAAPELAEWEWVARLAGAATALRSEIGAPLSASQQTELEQVIKLAQAALTSLAWEEAWDIGQATPLAQVVKNFMLAAEAPPFKVGDRT